MERRRRWAASGCLPPALAARFTLAEQAALAVVAAEHRRRGDCRLTNQEIADVAGVSLTTVKNALRAARGLNLISIEERRLSAFRNDSNVVRIVSPEWRAWLRLGGGGKFVPPSPTRYKNQQARPAKPARAAPTPMRGRAPHDQRQHGEPHQTRGQMTQPCPSRTHRHQPPFRPPRPTLSGSSRKTRRTHPRSIPNGPNQGTSAQRKRTGAAERQGAEPAAPRQDLGGQTRWAPNDSL